MDDLSDFLLACAGLVVLSLVIGGGVGWLTDRKDRRP